MAVPEPKALEECFKVIRKEVKINRCNRAILVGHNAPFDLNFINAGAERIKATRNPFHPFSTLDTVSLGAVMYGQTVLARLAQAAGMGWDADSAHFQPCMMLKRQQIYFAISSIHGKRWMPHSKPSRISRGGSRTAHPLYFPVFSFSQ